MNYLFQTKEITWDSSRVFPPVRCSLFSHGMTGVTFLGDPSAGSGLPRGTIVYTTQPLPAQVFLISGTPGAITQRHVCVPPGGPKH